MYDIKENALLHKQNIRFLRSRIEDFIKDVSYQVNTLKDCKCNIRKHYMLGNLPALRQEKSKADRTIRCLKKLQTDVLELRALVIDADVDKFDKRVNQSRELIATTLNAFNQYYDRLSLGSSRQNQTATSKTYTNGCVPNGSVDPADDGERQEQVLMRIPDDEYQLAYEAEVRKLENDSQDINFVFKKMAEMIESQKESVDRIENQIEESHVQVVSAQREVAQATSKIQSTLLPIMGGIVGFCAGGPIGLVAGLKVASVIALTGGVIGFSSCKVLTHRQQKLRKELTAEQKEENEITT